MNQSLHRQPRDRDNVAAVDWNAAEDTLDAYGKPYQSAVPGTLGGHCRSKIYGRLDCFAARHAIARGGYVEHRVFFGG